MNDKIIVLSAADLANKSALEQSSMSNGRGLLQGYVQSLFDEGIVNDQFNQIQSSRIHQEPDFILQLIEGYLKDVEMILSELTNHIDMPIVDFLKLGALACSLKERSTRIGAEHVRLACADLIQACDQRHEQHFSQSLTWLKSEFSNTRNKLEAFIQMERRIVRVMNKQNSKHGSAPCSVRHCLLSYIESS